MVVIYEQPDDYGGNGGTDTAVNGTDVNNEKIACGVIGIAAETTEKHSRSTHETSTIDPADVDYAAARVVPHPDPAVAAGASPLANPAYVTGGAAVLADSVGCMFVLLTVLLA